MYKFCDDHEWVGSQSEDCPECEELWKMQHPPAEEPEQAK